MRDVDHLHAIVAAVGEHGARSLQSQLQHALGEAGAGFIQQVLHIAARQAKPGGKSLHRERGIGEAGFDLRDDFLQPGGAQTAYAGDLGALTRRSESKRHKIEKRRAAARDWQAA
jgi:hypothetical protein